MREFWLLWGTGLLSLTLGLSPLFTSLPQLPTEALVRAAASFAITVALFLAGFVPLGLVLAAKIGLPRAPLLEAWLRGEESRHGLRKILIPAVVTGLGYLFMAVLLERRIPVLLGPAPPGQTAPPFFTFGTAGHQTQLHMAGFTGFAVALGFPFFEEILFRLFLFTIIAWLIGKLWRTAAGTPTTGAFWLTNVIQAFLFGLFHLPNGSMVWWEPWFIQTLAAPQCWLGLITGYLYWRRGLEAALIAHLSADLTLVAMITVFRLS